MLKQHARAVDVGARIFDLVGLTLSLPIAYELYARAARGQEPRLPDRYWFALVFVLITWSAAAYAFRVYDTYRTLGLAEELGRIGRALGLVGLLLVAAVFLVKHEPLPRLLFTLYLVTAFGAIAAGRVGVRWLVRSLRRRGYNSRRYAIVGTGALAKDVAGTFAANPQWGFQLAGYILPDGSGEPAPGTRVLGDLAQLARILDEQVLDEIVFAVSREKLPSIDEAVLLCEEQGVAVRVCLGALRVGTANMSVYEMASLPMLVFTRTSSDVISLWVKRAFDVVASAAVLLVLAPVLVAIALAIKLDSPGPVFFRQRRVGLSGRDFSMLKFRSMFKDAEQRRAALQAYNEMSGPAFKIRNDPRVTRVGRLLRRTSLDEVPQFWNVLRGDMSVVGPRPPIPSEVRQYKRWQRRRLSVRPGITCTWQVSGRNDIDFEHWMELDLEYIDHWSLWRDLQICFRTIPAVFTSRGAS